MKLRGRTESLFSWIEDAGEGDKLRARNRSSERTAMAFMRRTETTRERGSAMGCSLKDLRRSRGVPVCLSVYLLVPRGGSVLENEESKNEKEVHAVDEVSKCEEHHFLISSWESKGLWGGC